MIYGEYCVNNVSRVRSINIELGAPMDGGYDLVLTTFQAACLGEHYINNTSRARSVVPELGEPHGWRLAT